MLKVLMINKVRNGKHYMPYVKMRRIHRRRVVDNRGYKKPHLMLNAIRARDYVPPSVTTGIKTMW